MSLIPYAYDIERPFRMMERNFFKLNDFFDHSACHQLKPRDIYGDVINTLQKVLNPFEQISASMNRLALNEVGNLYSDKEKFQVNIDVQHFAPEEIQVKVIDGHVVVRGKHEERQDEHGYISREFVRRYALPKGCLPDTVESKLSSDGVLIVTAPKVLPMPSIGERIIPITHTGPVQKQLGPNPDSE